MARNLDMAALRALITVAETGSVTRAAGLLNLTQSAVSMQVRRLEEGLGAALFDRMPGGMTLTRDGEALAQYARRICAINDEAVERLTATPVQTEIRLGVPYDIVSPQIPRVLREMAARFPDSRINLVSSYTRILKNRFAEGAFDLIITTEQTPDRAADVLAERALRWVGAPAGTAQFDRPLRVAFKETCLFRPLALGALTEAGIGWEMTFDGDSESVVEANVSADLGVTVRMDPALPEGCAWIEGSLPDLPQSKICLYDQGKLTGAAVAALKDSLRAAYAD
ncbi:LysR family transcriptional regulator [Albirhodobacter sp. R86504]|uniref:LysR family transcriptional regulator n=1 Tax=Albirhodobacter sp. R86504 TaxID=3093848 RepID=UPI00366E38F5